MPRVTAPRGLQIVRRGRRIVGYRNVRTGRYANQSARSAMARASMLARGAGGRFSGGTAAAYRPIVQRRDLRTGSFVPFPTTRKAASDVAVEAQEYITTLQLFHQLTRGNVDRLVTAHAFDFVARAQMRCPVLTGRARNSIHVIPPNTASDSFRYTNNRGDSFDGSLSGERTGPGEAVAGSNVPYIMKLEAGSSRQAPQGMFAVSFREMTLELERQIEEETVRLWNSLS